MYLYKFYSTVRAQSSFKLLKPGDEFFFPTNLISFEKICEVFLQDPTTLDKQLRHGGVFSFHASSVLVLFLRKR